MADMARPPPPAMPAPPPVAARDMVDGWYWLLQIERSESLLCLIFALCSFRISWVLTFYFTSGGGVHEMGIFSFCPILEESQY